MYFKAHRQDEVQTAMVRSLRIYPILEVYRTFGDLQMQKGDAEGALSYYEKLDGFRQTPSDRIQNDAALGYAYFRARRLRDSRSRPLNILAANPGLRSARQLLQYMGSEIERGPHQAH